MSTIAVPNTTVTKVLSDIQSARAVWFQNLSAGDIYLVPAQMFDNVATPGFTTGEFMVAKAADGDHPNSLVITDPVLACCSWFAYQASGGSVNLNCGTWKTPI